MFYRIANIDCSIESYIFLTFCGFSMGGSNQYWAGRVYDLYVYFMMGTPEGSMESGFMEKPNLRFLVYKA